MDWLCHVYLGLYVKKQTGTYVCVCVCVCVYVNVLMYACIHTHICTCLFFHHIADCISDTYNSFSRY